MLTACQIRVLVVDDDENATRRYKSILTKAGFEVAIAEGQGASLFESARKTALDFRPQVVVMDFLLDGDESESEMTGLDLWQDPVFANSKACCILLSGYLDVPLTRDALMVKNIVYVLPKTEPVSKLIHTIHFWAHERCHCKIPEARIEWPAGLNEQSLITTLFDGQVGIRSDLAHDVIGRLFPSARLIKLENMGGEPRSADSVVRGRYVILEAHADDQRKVIVKMANAARIEQEKECYSNYIDNHLEGDFNAQLKAYQSMWDLGAVCYSFMGSPFHDLRLFSKWYAEMDDVDALLKPICHLFTEVWSRHYARKTVLNTSLFESYDQFFHLRQRIREMPKFELTVPGVRTKVPDPFHWAIRHEKESKIRMAQQAVTHGDLHGDNFFVDPAHAWVIDFERSGPGHILRDFVELEEDIIVRLAAISDDPPELFTRFIMNLLAPKSPLEEYSGAMDAELSPETQKALRVICGIRQLAFQVSAFQDMREYYWGLLLDSLFGALLVKPNFPRYKRILTLAALLCERLQSWDKPWPPSSRRFY